MKHYNRLYLGILLCIGYFILYSYSYFHFQNGFMSTSFQNTKELKHISDLLSGLLFTIFVFYYSIYLRYKGYKDFEFYNKYFNPFKRNFYLGLLFIIVINIGLFYIEVYKGIYVNNEGIPITTGILFIILGWVYIKSKLVDPQKISVFSDKLISPLKDPNYFKWHGLLFILLGIIYMSTYWIHNLYFTLAKTIFLFITIIGYPLLYIYIKNSIKN